MAATDTIQMGLDAPNYKAWWERARQSLAPPHPYEVLLNFGLPQETIQSSFWQILESACSNSEIPGTIDALGRHLCQDTNGGSLVYWKENDYFGALVCDMSNPKTLQEKDILCKLINRKGYAPEYEQDILSLVDLVSNFKTDRLSVWDNSAHDYWVAVGKLCTRMNCSSRILNKVFDQMDFENFRGDFNVYQMISTETFFAPGERHKFRPALDMDCVQAIQRVLPKIRSLNLMDQKWEINAFLSLLERIPGTSGLTRLKITVPSVFLGSPNPPRCLSNTQAALSYDNSLTVDDKTCELESFDLYFAASNNDHAVDGAYSAIKLLGCSPHLTRINLKLGSFPLELAAPYVLQAMTNAANLESVQIQCNEANDSDIRSFLQAMKGASSLWIFFLDELSGERRDQSVSFDEAILQVLEQHTNLRNISLPGSAWGSTHAPKIGYLLDLNMYGRKEARDPQTTLPDFLRLLDFTYYDRREWFCDPVYTLDLCRFNVCYGLLREMPGIWTANSAASAPRRGQKRKVSAL
jgi:hypothetical protein